MRFNEHSSCTSSAKYLVQTETEIVKSFTHIMNLLLCYFS